MAWLEFEEKAPRSGTKSQKMKSDLKKAMEQATSDAEDLFSHFSSVYVEKLEDTFDSLRGPIRRKIQKHFQLAAKYEWKALRADDKEEEEMYRTASGDELARAKTILVSESLAIALDQASLITETFSVALKSFGAILKTTTKSVVGGITSGAIPLRG